MAFLLALIITSWDMREALVYKGVYLLLSCQSYVSDKSLLGNLHFHAILYN